MPQTTMPPAESQHSAGGIGCGGGDGGGEEASGGATATVGALTTTTTSSAELSSAEAAAAVPRRAASEARTAEAAVEGGTPMVAVMITLPSSMRIETSDGATPATAATRRRRLEVSR